jgi:hypothetical protein
MLWGIETSPLPEDDDDDLVCVNAHDRCYGGAGGPCPYCERRATKPTEPIPCDDCGAVDVFYCECGDEPPCEVCNGTGELTRSGPLGHIERKPCWECQGEWW